MRIIRLSFLQWWDRSQCDVILHEFFIVAQLEVQDFNTCGKVAEFLHIALEETFLTKCPKVLQGLWLNLLGQMTLLTEKNACFVRFLQVFMIIVIEFVDVAINAIDMLFMIDEVIDIPFIVAQA